MPLRSLAFKDLAAQVTDHLTELIDKRRWEEWLPGERHLADELQVSRKTIRRSLHLLTHAGRIETVASHGHRILRRESHHGYTAATDQVVTVLCPEPLENLRPYTALWGGHLQARLHGSGIKLRWQAAPKRFSRNPVGALTKLTETHPSAGWILTHSTRSIQRWFMESGIPCVVSGSTHDGIMLPSMDVDHYGLCRHAAGVFVRNGHRNVAFLTEHTNRAGELESERGFIAGMQTATPAGKVQVVHHDRSRESILNALRRLFRSAQRPTALFVAQPVVYLSVLSLLAQQRLRIPHDLSVLCRDADPVFRYLEPQPSHYTFPPEKFARRMAPLVLRTLHTREKNPEAIRCTPTYVPGDTLLNISESKSIR